MAYIRITLLLRLEEFDASLYLGGHSAEVVAGDADRFHIQMFSLRQLRINAGGGITASAGNIKLIERNRSAGC